MYNALYGGIEGELTMTSLKNTVWLYMGAFAS